MLCGGFGQGRAGGSGFTQPAPHTAGFQINQVGFQVWGHSRGKRAPRGRPGPGQVHVLGASRSQEPYPGWERWMWGLPSDLCGGCEPGDPGPQEQGSEHSGAGRQLRTSFAGPGLALCAVHNLHGGPVTEQPRWGKVVEQLVSAPPSHWCGLCRKLRGRTPEDRGRPRPPSQALWVRPSCCRWLPAPVSVQDTPHRMLRRWPCLPAASSPASGAVC